MKHKQLRPGFALWLSIRFLTTVTVALSSPPLLCETKNTDFINLLPYPRYVNKFPRCRDVTQGQFNMKCQAGSKPFQERLVQTLLTLVGITLQEHLRYQAINPSFNPFNLLEHESIILLIKLSTNMYLAHIRLRKLTRKKKGKPL